MSVSYLECNDTIDIDSVGLFFFIIIKTTQNDLHVVTEFTELVTTTGMNKIHKHKHNYICDFSS